MLVGGLGSLRDCDDLGTGLVIASISATGIVTFSFVTLGTQ